MPDSHPSLELLMLGTGTSSGLPSIGCLTSDVGCFCCKSTLTDDPEARKNLRRNTSAVLRIPDKEGGRTKSLLIDCGKTFFSAALEHWPKKGLREIDALLITHAHADAILGLDDLRGWTLRGHIQKSIPIYCTQDTFDEIAKCFPYLADVGKATGGGDVPAFEWRIFDQNEHVDILGVDVLPLPVHHGKIFSTPGAAYYCLGFLFDRKIAYLSDVSLVPEVVWDLLEQECTLPEEWRPKKEGEVKKVENGVNGVTGSNVDKPVIQALVVDCLRIETFTSHFGLGEAIGTARRMGATKTYLVGFGHETSHACWVNTTSAFSSGAVSSLPSDPAVRLPIVSADERWKVSSGTPEPGKEDWAVHADYALRAIESFEGGVKGGLWVRPACDGMTIRVGEQGVSDDVYE